jgi:polysaccharide export outer membrane protein
MRRSPFVFALLLLSVPGIVAAQNTSTENTGAVKTSASLSMADTSTPAAPRLESRGPRYRLRKSDVIELVFALSPEFNQTTSIQPDGYITLKAVGTITAEGLTIPELTQQIQHAYSGILCDPIITIELKDFDKPYFIATGQVGKPGKYDLRSDLTVTEGVTIAGGLTEASKHSQVVLFRPVDNGLLEVHLIDIKKMLRSRDLTEDIHLRPGDMVYVPQNRISKISRYLPTSSLGLNGNPRLY